MRRLLGAGALAGALLLGGLHVPALAASGRPSASGHGTTAAVDEDGETVGKRQFSFTAVTHDDGTVTGQAQLRNPAYDFVAHIAITCLVVDGNMAHLGGTVTNTNDPNLAGQNAFFTVVDNGEPGAADTISSVYFDAEAPPSSCRDISPDDFVQNPILGGNIQVRP
jgi:hypothetical protein